MNTLLSLRTSLSHQSVGASLTGGAWGTGVALLSRLTLGSGGSHDTLGSLVSLTSRRTLGSDRSLATSLALLAGETHGTAATGETLKEIE